MFPGHTTQLWEVLEMDLMHIGATSLTNVNTEGVAPNLLE